MPFQIVVRGFEGGGFMPMENTCDGENWSPPLEWSEVPLGAKSLALIVDDPDAPNGTWTHWLLWDLPADARGLAGKFRAGREGRSGVNDFGYEGYGGPCPPRGHGVHRYFFHLYALSADSLGLSSGANRRDVDIALEGKVLAEAQFLGTYERK